MKRNVISSGIVAGGIALALGGTAFAQDKAAPAKPAAKPAPTGKAAVDVIRVTATVDSIDQATRTVTLKKSDGELVAFVAGPDVRNLDKVAKGDVVTLEYGQAVAVKLKKTDSKTRERTVTEAVERSKPGEKPGGVAMREVKAIASVEKIDAAKKTVTLRGPQHTVDLKVQDPEILKTVKVGDMVEATYTEAIAINVAAPKK